MKRNPVCSLRHCAAVVLCGAAVLASAPGDAAAQGTAEPQTILQTGAGGPLITGTQSFFMPGAPAAQQIQIAIGFSTDESLVPETFFDSLTLTLQDDVTSLTAVFFTIDRSGSFWAPTTPGGIAIDPDSIGRDPIPFPDLAPDYAFKVAYYLTLPIPAPMTGRQLTLYLDLFDNQNTAGSLGWMSQVTVVPEPSAMALIALGFALIARLRSKRA